MKNKISKISFVLAILIFAFNFFVYFSTSFYYSNADMLFWKNDNWVYEINDENNDGCIEIYSPQQLAYLCKKLNEGHEIYLGYDVKLISDLDMLGDKYYWTPIENFSKTFDGNGHIIKNLNISTENYSAGLFGTIKDGATVKNLIIQNVTISKVGKGINTNSVYVGGVVGSIDGENKTIVSNCSVINFNLEKSTFITNNPNFFYLGGISGRVATKFTSDLGLNWASSVSIIENCMVVSSNISLIGMTGKTSWTAIGGIVGETNNAIVSQCAVEADINNVNYPASICCGGIVGMSYTASILECYYAQKSSGINIGNAANSTKVNRADIGGIVGSMSAVVKLENCYSVGNFKGFVDKQSEQNYTIVEDLFAGYREKILSGTAYNSIITTGNFNEQCFYESPYGNEFYAYPQKVVYENSTDKFKAARVDCRVELNLNYKSTDLGDCNYTLLSPLKICGNMLFIGGVVGYISSSGNKINNCYSRVLNNFTHKITKEYNYYTKIREDTCRWVNKGEKWRQYNSQWGIWEEVVCTQSGYSDSMANYKFAACQTISVQAETVGDIYGFNASNEDILNNCYVIRDKNYSITFDSYEQNYYYSISSDGTPNKVIQYGDTSPMILSSLDSKRYNSDADGTDLGSPMLKNADPYNHDSRCNWWYLDQFEEKNYRTYWGVDFEKLDNFCYIKPFCMAYDGYNDWGTKIWNYYDSKKNFDELKVDANTNALTLQATKIKSNTCGNLDQNIWAVDSKINGGYPYLKCFYWKYHTSPPTTIS